MTLRLRHAWLVGVFAGTYACAQITTAPTTEHVSSTGTASGIGSTSFCLFELPGGGDRTQWINLGIVQYIEVRADEIRIFYGGGNLGSGHEARIAVKQRQDALALLDRLRETARACR